MHYTAYGLTIESELALPDLCACEPGPADVRVYRASLAHPAGRTGDCERYFHGEHGQAYLYWRRAGLFLVRPGEILADPAPNAETSLLSLVVNGPALGVLLHLRGTLALHASAVAVAGQAVAFLGESGMGKSTTAAAFQAEGCPLLCDDVVALDLAGPPLVLPALPRLKLYPHAAAALGYDPAAQQVFDSADQRRGYRAPAPATAPLPLAGLYVLADGPELALAPIAPRAAFLQLTRHSYGLRFVGGAGLSPQHFRQCEQLLAAVPVWQLSRPRAFAALPALIALVAEQLACGKAA